MTTINVPSGLTSESARRIQVGVNNSRGEGRCRHVHQNLTNVAIFSVAGFMNVTCKKSCKICTPGGASVATA